MSLFIRQDVFDTVLNHLRKQGPATDDRGECVYRTAEGKRCAVGVLIPDDMYDPDIEGGSCGLVAHTFTYPPCTGRSHALKATMDRVYPTLTEDDWWFLKALQVAHDDSADNGMERFEGAMADVAEKHGLIYTPGAEAEPRA
ncbi:MAG: hypothetical protein ACK54C_01980 [Betaproteobacteria bacterium]